MRRTAISCGLVLLIVLALVLVDLNTTPISATHALIRGLGEALGGNMYMSRTEVLPTNIRVEQMTLAEVEIRLNGEVSPPIDRNELSKIIPENLIPPDPDLTKKYWLVSIDGLWRTTGGFFSEDGIRALPPLRHVYVYFDVESGRDIHSEASP